MSPNKPVSIASWNCRGFRGKLPEIQANDYIVYDLWCLQETMVTENTYTLTFLILLEMTSVAPANAG